WDVWREAGMAVSYQSASGASAIHPELIADGLGAAEGGRVFAAALQTELPQVIVSVRDFHARVELWTGAASPETPAEPSAPVEQLGRHERPSIATPLVAPRDELEQEIALIWQELLGLAEVGVHDSFFELGGHSLLGLRLAARIQSTFHVDCSLKH